MGVGIDGHRVGSGANVNPPLSAQRIAGGSDQVNFDRIVAVAGRDHEGMSRLPGVAVNQIAIRASVSALAMSRSLQGDVRYDDRIISRPGEECQPPNSIVPDLDGVAAVPGMYGKHSVD